MPGFFNKNLSLFVPFLPDTLKAHLNSQIGFFRKHQYQISLQQNGFKLEYVQGNVLTMEPPSAVAWGDFLPTEGGTIICLHFKPNDSADMVVSLSFCLSLLFAVGVFVASTKINIPPNIYLAPLMVMLCATGVVALMFFISVRADIVILKKALETIQ